MRKKVTVVGGGFVGSTTAQRIHDAGLADVVLTDILDGVPAGKALDMAESAPIFGTDAHATGISTAGGDYKETANSDIIVITAGFPRKPGMSRDDLLKANYDVIKGVVEAVVKLSPNAILIMVTNPLDAMAHVAHGSARALLHRRRNSPPCSFAQGKNRRNRNQNPKRRRGNCEPAQDGIGVLRALRGGIRNGRRDFEGQEENPALRRLPRRRVRNKRPVRRRTCKARRKRDRADHRDQTRA
jgi:hypothetical protein